MWAEARKWSVGEHMPSFSHPVQHRSHGARPDQHVVASIVIPISRRELSIAHNAVPLQSLIHVDTHTYATHIETVQERTKKDQRLARPVFVSF